MCGIVGGISERNTVSVILEGLSRLEYRGYDSVGIAIIDENNELKRSRVAGRVAELKAKITEENFKAKIGIGHTRWATHGEVNEANAHPHFSSNTIAVVHNGIIENYQELRDELIQAGYQFDSQTDTEVIAHLVHSYYIKSFDLTQATCDALKRLHGAYAIGLINKDNPVEIVCARQGAPLLLGLGIDEIYFASDVSALLPITQKVVYLEDADVVKFSRTSYQVLNTDELVNRSVRISELSSSMAELGNYRHFMQKEIFEQPRALADTIHKLGLDFSPEAYGKEAAHIFNEIDRIQIIACGSSFIAGSIAKYWLEEYANIATVVDIASEYRYSKKPSLKNTLIISISQSGETADTLASVKYAIKMGMDKTLCICNVAESSLVRLSRLNCLTDAGPEIGVASTKALTTQLLVLLHFTFVLAKLRNNLEAKALDSVKTDFLNLPQLILKVLNIEPSIHELAKEFEFKEHALFLGRHVLSEVAREGALKLKEISYIHAESYAAGELKHGPLALIDKEMPVILCMPGNLLLDKVKSNLQEVLAREGLVYLIGDTQVEGVRKFIDIGLCNIPPILLPIIYIIPLQLLAYHTAIIKGTDVDKPRNLAKSVTVE